MSDLAHSPVSRLIDIDEVRRFESVEEIRALPGYVSEIDPATTKIAKLIGWYAFPEEVPCGRANCHQPHKIGYVCETEDGRLVQIGNVCGEEYFGDSFIKLKNELEEAKRRQNRRIAVAEVLDQADEIFDKAEDLKSRKYGAAWVNRSCTNFSRAVPSEAMEHIRRRARTGETRITRTRVLTSDEVEIRRVAEGRPLRIGGEEEEEVRVEETVAEIQGLEVWNGDLKAIVVDNIEEKLRELQRTDILQLSQRKLIEWVNWAGEIPRQFEKAEALISAGRAFFTEENINNLKRLKLTPESAKVMRRIWWNVIDCAPRAY